MPRHRHKVNRSSATGRPLLGVLTRSADGCLPFAPAATPNAWNQSFQQAGEPRPRCRQWFALLTQTSGRGAAADSSHLAVGRSARHARPVGRHGPRPGIAGRESAAAVEPQAALTRRPTWFRLGRARTIPAPSTLEDSGALIKIPDYFRPACSPHRRVRFPTGLPREGPIACHRAGACRNASMGTAAAVATMPATGAPHTGGAGAVTRSTG